MTTFRSFAFRDYRIWFIGQSISQTGYWFYVVAQALLVLRLTGNGAMVGVVTAMQFLPLLVFGLYAGVLTDRLDTRRLLIATQSVLMVSSLLLGVLVIADDAPFAVVLCLAAVSGIAWAFDQPGRRMFAADLVPRDALTNAVSLNGALNQIARLAGPLLAAALLAVADIGWCFVANGLSSIAVIIALAAIGRSRAPRARPPAPDADLRHAARLVWHDPHLRLSLGLLFWTSTLAFSWNVLFPLLAVRELDGSTTTYALLMASMSIGSIVGALWLARRTVAGTRLLAGGSCLYGAALLGVAAAPTVGVAVAAVSVMGVGSTVLVNGGAASLQLGTEPDMRGRMMAFFSVAVLGGVGLGGPLQGLMAEHFGTRTALVSGGIAAVLGGAVVLAVITTRRSTPSRSESPSRRWSASPCSLPSESAHEGASAD
jgi:MFS family permease